MKDFTEDQAAKVRELVTGAFRFGYGAAVSDRHSDSQKNRGGPFHLERFLIHEGLKPCKHLERTGPNGTICLFCGASDLPKIKRLT